MFFILQGVSSPFSDKLSRGAGLVTDYPTMKQVVLGYIVQVGL